MDIIEDSLFNDQELQLENDGFVNAFHSYFILRSYNPKYYRDSANVGLIKTRENMLNFLIREAGKFKQQRFKELSTLMSCEFVVGSGYNEFVDVKPIIEKIGNLTKEPQIQEFSLRYFRQHHWKSQDNIKDFQLEDVYGKRMQFSNVEQDYILIDFWFIGCPPCEKNHLILQDFSNKYSEQLLIVSINFEDEVSEVKKWMETNQTNWPSIVEEKDTELYNFFRPESYPRYHLISKNLSIVKSDIKIEKVITYLK